MMMMRTKNQTLFSLATIFFAVAGLTIGLFWDSNALSRFGGSDSTAILGVATDSGQVSEATAEALLIDARNYFAPGAPLQWKLITAEQTIGIPKDILAFREGDGQKVSAFLKGERYYLVDREAYLNFVPHSVDDLAKLQLPNKPLTPRSEYSAYVEAADTWLVPASIPGEVDIIVHHYNEIASPRGALVDQGFTVWVIPAILREGKTNSTTGKIIVTH